MYYRQIVKTGILVGLMTSTTPLGEGIYSQALASENTLNTEIEEKNNIKKEENIKKIEIEDKKEIKYDPDSIYDRILKNDFLKKLQLPNSFSGSSTILNSSQIFNYSEKEKENDKENDFLVRKNSFFEMISFYKTLHEDNGLKKINKIFSEFRDYISGKESQKLFIDKCIREIIKSLKAYDFALQDLKISDKNKLEKEGDIAKKINENVLLKLNVARIGINFFYDLAIELNNYALSFLFIKEHYEKIIESYVNNKNDIILKINKHIEKYDEKIKTLEDNFKKEDKKSEIVEKEKSLITKLRNNKKEYLDKFMVNINEHCNNSKKYNTSKIDESKNYLIEIFGNYIKSSITNSIPFVGTSEPLRIKIPPEGSIILETLNYSEVSREYVNGELILELNEKNKVIDKYNKEKKFKINERLRLSNDIFEILEIKVKKEGKNNNTDSNKN